MSDYKKFKEDLEVGKKWENVVCMYLFFNFKFKWLKPSNIKEFDIYGEHEDGRLISFEVKTDLYEDTGNMAIETSFKGKPSGIMATTSDYFVYLYPKLNQMYMIESIKLKELVNDGNHKIVMGGDRNDSELHLLPRSKYADNFKLILDYQR
jgi:hypothetical protein